MKRDKQEIPWWANNPTPHNIEEKKEELEQKYLLTGRPDRDTIIGQDDILNLKIALGSTNDVNEFIKEIA